MALFGFPVLLCSCGRILYGKTSIIGGVADSLAGAEGGSNQVLRVEVKEMGLIFRGFCAILTSNGV